MTPRHPPRALRGLTTPTRRRLRDQFKNRTSQSNPGCPPEQVPSCLPVPSASTVLSRAALPSGPGRASPAAAARLTTFDTAQSNDSHHSKGLLLLWRNDQLPLTTLGRLAIQPNCQKATDGDVTRNHRERRPNSSEPVRPVRETGAETRSNACPGPYPARRRNPRPEGQTRSIASPRIQSSREASVRRAFGVKGRADAVTDGPLRVIGPG